MKLKCENIQFEPEFVQVPLVFEGKPYKDVFGEKNNKTVAETLVHQRYKKFERDIKRKYPDSLEKPLGSFLLELKKNGDAFYKQFLNRYGDLRYSIFKISNLKYLDSMGVYAYFSEQNLKYIGRCKDSMKKRVNQGYGKIHPKNCYLDGQATNCHLNARITTEENKVTLWLHKMDSELEIEKLEKVLIHVCNPPWNIQRG